MCILIVMHLAIVKRVVLFAISLSYAPGALKTMTDWVHGVIDNPARIASMKQEGSARPSGVLSKLVRYEKLRWFGNGTVQVALYILFLVSFLANTIAAVRNGLARLFHRQKSEALSQSNKVKNFQRSVCAFNLLILTAMQVDVLLVFDQIHPSCPNVLMYLPLLGTISMLATIALLIVLAKSRRDPDGTVFSKLRAAFDVLGLILFVPYLIYWNLIGFHF